MPLNQSLNGCNVVLEQMLYYKDIKLRRRKKGMYKRERQAIYRSSRRRNDDQRRAPSNRPLAAAGAARRLPAPSQLGIAIYPRSSRSCRTAASPMSTSIAIERQMLEIFFFLLLSLSEEPYTTPEGRLFLERGGGWCDGAGAPQYCHLHKYRTYSGPYALTVKLASPWASFISSA